jgi:hypothetical protein
MDYNAPPTRSTVSHARRVHAGQSRAKQEELIELAQACARFESQLVSWVTERILEEVATWPARWWEILPELLPADPHWTPTTPFALTIAEFVNPQRKRGRPPQSGTYPTAWAFRQAVAPIIRSLRQQGIHPSRERVANLLPTKTTDHQLGR